MPPSAAFLGAGVFSSHRISNSWTLSAGFSSAAAGFFQQLVSSPGVFFSETDLQVQASAISFRTIDPRTFSGVPEPYFS